MIDRLVANGWVERRTARHDRRIKRVFLTGDAERVHKRIWRVAEETVDAALADLTVRERRQLMDLLSRVKATLVSADEGEATTGGRKRAPNGAGRHHGRAAP
jgi:DNA-binding MarR family transcriptional regulator